MSRSSTTVSPMSERSASAVYSHLVSMQPETRGSDSGCWSAHCFLSAGHFLSRQATSSTSITSAEICGSSERRLMGVRRAAPPAPLREGPHVRAVMWASHLMGKMRGVPCYHGDDWRAPALRLPLDPADATESTDSPCRTTGGGPEDGASAFRRFLALTCAHSAAHASPHTVGCEGCAAAAARDPTHALACRTRPQLPHALRLDPCGGTGCDLGLQRSRGEARAALCVLGANPRSV